MPFPFWWVGAFTAGLFLGVAFTMFGIAMRLLDRTTAEIRGSMLPGLVSGFRDWARATIPPAPASSPRAVAPDPTAVEDDSVDEPVPTQRVLRH